MKEVAMKMLERAQQLLESGEVARVVGWKKGDFCYDPSPACFESVEELKDFTYDYFQFYRNFRRFYDYRADFCNSWCWTALY